MLMHKIRHWGIWYAFQFQTAPKGQCAPTRGLGHRTNTHHTVDSRVCVRKVMVESRNHCHGVEERAQSLFYFIYFLCRLKS